MRKRRPIPTGIYDGLKIHDHLIKNNTFDPWLSASSDIYLRLIVQRWIKRTYPRTK